MTGDTFVKRGVVICPEDLSWGDWVKTASGAGINYMALHVLQDEAVSSFQSLIDFLHTDQGGCFLAQADKAGIEVNFEIHMLSHFLPRDEFSRHPEFFRMDETGERAASGNFCPSSRGALELIAANICAHVRELSRFTRSDRYYFWSDDGRPWCCCPHCWQLTASDQNLIFVNTLAQALRSVHPEARVPYLAYLDVLEPPQVIKPDKGVFLQYAPIERCYEHSLSNPDCEINRRYVRELRRLLDFFGHEEAEILEYWLDVSKFSGYRMPVKELPIAQEIMASDIDFYAEVGIRRISTFAAWLNIDYAANYGVLPVINYGQCLRSAE